MISIDGSLVVQIVNFIVLIWVLNLVLYRPIRNILSQRKEKITGLEAQIDESNQMTQEKDRVYLEGIKQARAKGLTEKEKMVQTAVEEEKKIIAKINERAQTELAAVKGKIIKDAEKVRLSLLEEINTFAREIGQKLLGRAV